MVYQEVGRIHLMVTATTIANIGDALVFTCVVEDADPGTPVDWSLPGSGRVSLPATVVEFDNGDGTFNIYSTISSTYTATDFCNYLTCSSSGTVADMTELVLPGKYVTVHDEPSVKSHIENSCFRSKSNNNPIHTSNNSKVQRIITPLLDIV